MESVSVEDLEEVDLLLTGLEISRERGNLILCSVASPAYRDKVIAAVAARFPIRVLSVETGDKLISDLRNAKAEKKEILIWTFPEKLSNDILDALNNFRELFYDAGMPSLVFITPTEVDEVIWKAPDFWRYRGGYHILKGEVKGAGLRVPDAMLIPMDYNYNNKEELLRRKSINEHFLGMTQDYKIRTKILSELGTIHLLLSEPHKAIEFYDRALQISREVGDRQSEGIALGNLGNAYYNISEIRMAIEFYEKARKISHEIGDLWGEVDAVGTLGKAHSDLGNKLYAKEFYKQALKISRDIVERALFTLGNAYFNLGEPRKSIGHYEQSLHISRESRNYRSERNCLRNLGNAYSDLGNTRLAIKFHEQALKISCEIGDRPGEVAARILLGNAYFNLSEPRMAIKFYEQALKISRDIGDSRGEEATLGNLGLAYSYLGEPRKAIESYEQELVIVRKIGDRRGEGNALWNMSLVLDELGLRAKAIECAKAAIRKYEEIEDPNAEMVRRTLKKWETS